MSKLLEVSSHSLNILGNSQCPQSLEHSAFSLINRPGVAGALLQKALLLINLLNNSVNDGLWKCIQNNGLSKKNSEKIVLGTFLGNFGANFGDFWAIFGEKE